MTPRDRAIKALTQAFAPIHETPAGKLCWFGRLDRGFELLRQNPGDQRYIDAVETLKVQCSAALREYRLAMEAYPGDDATIPPCNCEYCKRQPTFGGVKL